LFNTSDDTWKLDKNALIGKQMMIFKSKAKLLSKNWKKTKEDLKKMDLMEAYEMQLWELCDRTYNEWRVDKKLPWW